MFAIAHRTIAQELEPRSYSAAPTGTTFIIGGFGRSQGPVLVDPSLDVDNVAGDPWVWVRLWESFPRANRGAG